MDENDVRRTLQENLRKIKENSRRASKLPKHDASVPRISSYAADNHVPPDRVWTLEEILEELQ